MDPAGAGGDHRSAGPLSPARPWPRGRIHHPNVVTVFDVVEHKSATWLVMELLEGGTAVGDLIGRTHGAEEAVTLLIPAMRGVAAAHAPRRGSSRPQPDNIFICRATEGQRPRRQGVLDLACPSCPTRPATR